MKSFVVCTLLAGVAAVQPLAAAPVTLKVSGKVVGADYGQAAAQDIYAVAPVGSAVSFAFSYDTNLTPTFAGSGYANYSFVPIDGTLAIGSSAFAIPIAYINSGTGPYTGVRFSVHQDNVPFQPARIAGYQLLDFYMELFDSTGAAVRGELPATLDLSKFDLRVTNARFAFGANGETRLNFALDRIANVDAVPEPGTWLCLVAGFATIGLSARRTRRLAVV